MASLLAAVLMAREPAGSSLSCTNISKVNSAGAFLSREILNGKALEMRQEKSSREYERITKIKKKVGARVEYTNAKMQKYKEWLKQGPTSRFR